MENISIVMLSHNNRDINICMAALIEQMTSGDELLLVDDHSDDAYLKTQILPSLSDNVHLIAAERFRGNRGYNRNLGAQTAKNPILLFVDGDMILCGNALDLLRHGYDQGSCVAFIGTEHGMKDDDLQMSLRMGQSDYRQLAMTKGGRAFLFQHPLLQDCRKSDLNSPQYSPYYWIYFYTSFCSVTREAFMAVGGFDEAFTTWGSEDVDLGYRLSRYGQIGFLAGLDGLHMPHSRNIWQEEIFDRDNIRYILDKYRTWPLELLTAFDSSCRLYGQMEKIYRSISAWGLSPLPVRQEADSLWIDLPAAGREDMTAQWFDGSGGAFHAPLLGIALPFCDQRFQNAYLTANIFAYPRILTARILMESTRVSRHVYLIPAARPRRQLWEDDAFSELSTLHHVFAVSSDPSEFMLTERGDGIIEVLSPENRSRLSAAFSQAPVLPSAATRRKWQGHFSGKNTSYTLVNLVGGNGVNIKEKLENALGLSVTRCYDFRRPSSNAFALEDELPLALCQHRAPLLYVVPEARRVKCGSAWQRNMGDDLMFDLTGALWSCGELYV